MAAMMKFPEKLFTQKKVDRPVSGEPTIQSPRELSEVGWFPWDALPEPLFLPFEHLLTGQCDPAPWNFSEDEVL
jgi:hypothetical protein